MIETYLNTIGQVEGTTCCCRGRKIQQSKLADLVMVSIAKMRLIDHGNSYKRSHSVEAGFQFRSLVHYRYERKYGGMKADRVSDGRL